MPATALEPVCLDPLAWRRYEREVATFRDKHERAEQAVTDLGAAVPELEQVVQDAFERDPWLLGKPPTNPGPVWQCPSCDRRFPSPASTARHMEFEHAEVVAC